MCPSERPYPYHIQQCNGNCSQVALLKLAYPSSIRDYDPFNVKYDVKWINIYVFKIPYFMHKRTFKTNLSPENEEKVPNVNGLISALKTRLLNVLSYFLGDNFSFNLLS